MLILLNLAFERKPSLCKGGGTTEGGGRIVNEDYNLIFAITTPQSNLRFASSPYTGEPIESASTVEGVQGSLSHKCKRSDKLKFED